MIFKFFQFFKNMAKRLANFILGYPFIVQNKINPGNPKPPIIKEPEIHEYFEIFNHTNDGPELNPRTDITLTSYPKKNDPSKLYSDNIVGQSGISVSGILLLDKKSKNVNYTTQEWNTSIREKYKNSQNSLPAQHKYSFERNGYFNDGPNLVNFIKEHADDFYVLFGVMNFPFYDGNRIPDEGEFLGYKYPGINEIESLLEGNPTIIGNFGDAFIEPFKMALSRIQMENFDEEKSKQVLKDIFNMMYPVSILIDPQAKTYKIGGGYVPQGNINSDNFNENNNNIEEFRRNQIDGVDSIINNYR